MTETWVDLIENDDALWDQNAFNDLVRRNGSCAARPDESGLFQAFGGVVAVGTLPAAQFANGHVFYVQRTHSQLRQDPYAVHNTFQYGGTPGKRHRMREANAWLGEDAHSRFFLKTDDADAEPRIGFLSYDPKIPSDLDVSIFANRSWPASRDDTFPTIETTRDPVVEAHAKLVEFQLAQLRTAVAAAVLLRRVVIAPPFLCGLDRVWFPHFGRFPGSQFALPFVCPLDHVLAVERSTKMDQLREHSFLTHPELPSAIARSVAVVDVVAAEDSGDDGVDFPSTARVCLTGAGTGANAVGLSERPRRRSNSKTFPNAFGEKCGWFGIEAEPTLPKRRARVFAENQSDPVAFAAAVAGVRSSRVLHFSKLTPFMKGRAAHEGWERLYEDNADVTPPDAWCCAKDGHRQFRVP